MKLGNGAVKVTGSLDITAYSKQYDLAGHRLPSIPLLSLSEVSKKARLSVWKIRGMRNRG
jgi:hypothetical protein